MAISASGLYGLTIEKMFIDTVGKSLEGEENVTPNTGLKAMLVTDTYTHNYDTHAFRSDVTNEVSGTGYSTGGGNVTTTEITVASPSAGVLKYDHDDESWANSSISSAMAMIGYFNFGTAGTDQLVYLLDFVTAVTTSNGLLTVQIGANGVFNLDYTP